MDEQGIDNDVDVPDAADVAEEETSSASVMHGEVKMKRSVEAVLISHTRRVMTQNDSMMRWMDGWWEDFDEGG